MLNNLVIGSEGFVGKPLCKFLENKGERVVRFDIKRGENEDGRSQKLPLDGVDRIYFLAWEVGGAKYLYKEEVQQRQLDWNLKLMLNVMPQLHAAGKPFLFVSSQLAEECDTVYGVTKHLGEVWTKIFNGVRVRLWNVYGSVEETTERSHVVSDFVHQAAEAGEIKMLTTGEEKRQFIHVDDVCEAFHTALSLDVKDVYDVTSFEWVKVRDVAETIAKMSGNAKVVPGSVVGSTPITPIKGKIPGWQPKVTLEEGLSRMVKQLKARNSQSFDRAR